MYVCMLLILTDMSRRSRVRFSAAATNTGYWDKWPYSSGHTTAVFQQATYANSASYPQRDEKCVPAKVRWRSANRVLWFITLVDKRAVAGKTVWSLVSTCHTSAHNKRYTNRFPLALHSLFFLPDTLQVLYWNTSC